MAIILPPTSPQTPEQPPEQSQAQIQQLPRTAPLSAPAERHMGLRLTLSALDAFLAIGAIAGALFVVPGLPRDYLLRGPFTDYTIPALALGILVGGIALVAAITVLMRPALGALIAILSGVAIIVFELVEIVVVGLTVIAQPTEPAAWLQIFYLALGVLIIAFGAVLWRRAQRRTLRPATLPRR